jgi:hypothetical protein
MPNRPDTEFRGFMDKVLGAEKPVRLLKEQIELAQMWRQLPENERGQFKRAIAARALDWTAPAPARPAIWPMRLQIVRDDPSV